MLARLSSLVNKWFNGTLAFDSTNKIYWKRLFIYKMLMHSVKGLITDLDISTGNLFCVSCIDPLLSLLLQALNIATQMNIQFRVL